MAIGETSTASDLKTGDTLIHKPKNGLKLLIYKDKFVYQSRKTLIHSPKTLIHKRFTLIHNITGSMVIGF